MKSGKIIFCALFTLTFLTGLTAQANALTVDLALVLAVDVSGSVDATEFNLQRQGYVDAFNNASIVSAIENGDNGAIAVSLVYWANSQELAVDWSLINDTASSQAFATKINNAARPDPNTLGTQTGLGTAITYSSGLFTNLFIADSQELFDAPRWVIDVSGDGTRSFGEDPDVARDNALAAGVDTINGLPIINDIPTLLSYYQDNVIGGAGAFAISAADYNTFGNSVEDKILFEVTGDRPGGVVPEPATMFLFGIGSIFGSVTMRRKR
ncbi:MAG: DUF1194 domain-containing protein [Candidatus Omnitrophica bacterium]|nr:DUF1194 domain-containing protein [Candidatus Omnitrophota bacterium]